MEIGVLEQFLRQVAQVVSLAAEAVAMVIVAIAVAQSIIAYVFGLIKWSRALRDNAIRLRLGRALTLALELLVAADILRTAVAPSWEEIGQLGAIVAIRTVLNFFLQREIAHEESLSSDDGRWTTDDGRQTTDHSSR